MSGRKQHHTIRMYAAIFRDGSDGRRLYISHWSWHARAKFASDNGKKQYNPDEQRRKWQRAYKEGWRVVPIDVTLVKPKEKGAAK